LPLRSELPCSVLQAAIFWRLIKLPAKSKKLKPSKLKPSKSNPLHPAISILLEQKWQNNSSGSA
jgi:hypothetical protein